VNTEQGNPAEPRAVRRPQEKDPVLLRPRKLGPSLRTGP
jgi:hypothetical protein